VSPSEAFIDIIIDEDYDDKTNRKHAMGDQHKVVGIAYGPHKDGGYCTVIVYGDQIIDKKSEEIKEYAPKPKSNEPFTKNWEKFTEDIFNY